MQQRYRLLVEKMGTLISRMTLLPIAFRMAGVAAALVLSTPGFAAPELPAGSREIRQPTRDNDGRIVPMDASPALEPVREEDSPPANLSSDKPRVCGATTENPGKVRIENTGSIARPPGPVTFGVFFRQGMVPESVTAADQPSQVDIKRRWPDGSLKHAVMTVAMPGMAPNALVPVAFKPAPVSKSAGPVITHSELMDMLPPVEVGFVIHGGPKLISNPQSAGPQRSNHIWLQGNQLIEYLLVDVPVDGSGKKDLDIEVRYHVRHYPEAGTTRVAVIVENTKWTSPGNIPYDVEIRIDGAPAFRQDEVGTWPKKSYIGHSKRARWIKRFWIGQDLSAAHVRYEVPCLIETGLLPRYDTSVDILPAVLKEQKAAWRRSSRDILQNGLILPYFPTTGRRSEIGPLPKWAAIYLLSQDPDAWTVTAGIADLSGGVNIHLRDPKTDRPVSIDDYPGFSLNRRGTKMKMPVRDRDDAPWILNEKSFFSPDVAHQASFTYLPYLVTGDYYYFEEMAFWANYNFLMLHNGWRQGAKGLIKEQIRGMAWQLRNLVHVAGLAPDNDDLKAYFETKLVANFDYFGEVMSKRGDTQIGIFVEWYAYTRGWGAGWTRRYASLPVWQHNFLAWSVSHVVDQGYPAAVPIRDYLMRIPIGLVNNPDQITPHAACAYFILVGKNENKKYSRAKTWKEVDYLTYEAPKPEGREIQRPTSSRGYYCRILRATLAMAVRAEVPGARVALDWLDAQQKPGSLKRYFQTDPTWALMP